MCHVRTCSVTFPSEVRWPTRHRLTFSRADGAHGGRSVHSGMAQQESVVAGSRGCRWRSLRTKVRVGGWSAARVCCMECTKGHLKHLASCAHHATCDLTNTRSVQLERGRLLRLLRHCRTTPRNNRNSRQCATGQHEMQQHHQVNGDQIHHQPQARHGPRPQHARRRRRCRVHRAQRPAHRAGRVLQPPRVAQRAERVRGFATVRVAGRGCLQIVSVPAGVAGGGGRPAKALRGGGVRRLGAALRRVQRPGQLWGGGTSRVRFFRERS